MKTTTERITTTATTPNTAHGPATRTRKLATGCARMSKRIERMSLRAFVIMSSLLLLALSPSADASTAYGTVNNFDCVNHTGVEAHGFEIELDDIHSTDISYTYDYNHYSIPRITEDNTDPLHPKVFIRYAATRKPDGTWTAFTAIPSGPISPTQGHQFTNP